MSNGESILSEERKASIKLNPSMILMMTDSFEEIMSYLPKSYGSAGTSMIYSMGYQNGVHEVKRLREELRTLNLALTKSELLDKALKRISSMGWGKITVENNNEVMGKVNIFIQSNPFRGECENHGTPGCNFLRGYVAGIISETIEEEVQYGDYGCLEVDVDCCLLRVSKKSTMQTE